MSREFGEEMYYCLGCLACTTACPAGVDYPELFEHARAEVEEAGVMETRQRRFWRWLTLKQLFAKPWLLRLVGQCLRYYQETGLQSLVRRLGLTRLLPGNLGQLEPTTPTVRAHFSDVLIHATEKTPKEERFRVGMLTGCVQDLVFSDINRDTVEVLMENGCTVVTPREQGCCGSLHAHNGDLEQAKIQARRLIDQFDGEGELDAIISNAAGCGSHLKHFSSLLKDDPAYAERAVQWDAKVRDVSEWLVEIGFRSPRSFESSDPVCLTYHEACHLCHGQGISSQPRELLTSLPGAELVELSDATHCCGSAGIYNITQPEQAGKLQVEKIEKIRETKATIVATANPGCHLQIQNGLGSGEGIRVRHPVSLLAEAYRREEQAEGE